MRKLWGLIKGTFNMLIMIIKWLLIATLFSVAVIGSMYITSRVIGIGSMGEVVTLEGMFTLLQEEIRNVMLIVIPTLVVTVITCVALGD